MNEADFFFFVRGSIYDMYMYVIYLYTSALQRDVNRKQAIQRAK